jgi:hypothetical protein
MLGTKVNACDFPHMRNVFKDNFQQVTTCHESSIFSKDQGTCSSRFFKKKLSVLEQVFVISLQFILLGCTCCEGLNDQHYHGISQYSTYFLEGDV